MDENTLKLKLTVFNLIVIISFILESAAVQSQNNNKCVTVSILTEGTVHQRVDPAICLNPK
jgi:hypothetical protein